MNRKVLDTIKAHNMLGELSNGQTKTVLVALSGGADSMALLHILLELSEMLSISVCAAHVNHNLRASADGEALFVKRHCEELKLPFILKNVDVNSLSEKEGLSIETAARKLRYEALGQAAEELSADFIATAHHAGDNTETVLLNLIRGTGLKGLCGIPPVRGNIIRPLLGLTKREILDYCNEKHIEYITDESNFSLNFTRNRLRSEVIPQLLQINPNLDRTVARVSNNLREDEAVLTRMAKEFNDYKPLSDGYSINRQSLCALELGVAARVLLYLFDQISPQDDLCAAHIESVLKIANDASPSKQVSLPGGLSAWTSYDRLFLCKKERPGFGEFYFELGFGQNVFKPLGICVDIDIVDGKKIYSSEKISCFDFDKICDTLYKSFHIRSKRDGDSYPPYGMKGHHRSLKKMMIDAKIPRELRERLPVFEIDDTILWIPGFPINQNFRVTDKTVKTLVVSIRKA